MRPLLLLLSLTIAAVPALEKVCDLRCATAYGPPTAVARGSANGTHHCARMPERPKTAPDSRDGRDPCGHGHGGGAVIGSIADRAVNGPGDGMAPSLFTAPGGFEPRGLASVGRVRPVRSAESPPSSLSFAILRL